MHRLRFYFQVALSMLTASYWQWKAARAFKKYAAGANRAPHTECINCGVPTQPGPGAARCQECWEDRCGHYFVTGEEGSTRLDE